MAKEKTPLIERIYNIPLRKEFLKVPKYKRTNKAVKAIKEFLSKHMKIQTVKIGKYLNEALWRRGIKNPPHHIKVVAKKYDDFVLAEIPGVEEKVKEMEKKKEKKEKIITGKEKIEKEELRDIKKEIHEKPKVELKSKTQELRKKEKIIPKVNA